MTIFGHYFIHTRVIYSSSTCIYEASVDLQKSLMITALPITIPTVKFPQTKTFPFNSTIDLLQPLSSLILYKWLFLIMLKFANQHGRLLSRELIFAVKDALLSPTITTK